MLSLFFLSLTLSHLLFLSLLIPRFPHGVSLSSSSCPHPLLSLSSFPSLSPSLHFLCIGTVESSLPTLAVSQRTSPERFTGPLKPLSFSIILFIHTHTHTHTWTREHTQPRQHTNTHTHTHTHTCPHTHMHTHTHANTYRHTEREGGRERCRKRDSIIE